MLKNLTVILMLLTSTAFSAMPDYSLVYQGTNPLQAVYQGDVLLWQLQQQQSLYALSFNGSSDYVDTGVYMEANKTLEMRMFYRLVSYSTSVNPEHGFSSGTNPRFFFGLNNASGTNSWYGYNTVALINGADTGSYDKWRGAILNNTTFSENGVTIASYNAATNVASTGAYSIHVGCRFFNGTASARYPVIVHRWQILKNGVVIQDCKANDSGSFTDSVSGTNVVGKNGAMTVLQITTNQPSLWIQ